MTKTNRTRYLPTPVLDPSAVCALLASKPLGLDMRRVGPLVKTTVQEQFREALRFCGTAPGGDLHLPKTYRLRASTAGKEALLRAIQPEQMAFGVLASGFFAPDLPGWPVRWMAYPTWEALMAGFRKDGLEGALVEASQLAMPDRQAQLALLRDRHPVARITRKEGSHPNDIPMQPNRRGTLILVNGAGSARLETFLYRASTHRLLRHLARTSQRWVLNAHHAWDEGSQTLVTELGLARLETVAQAKEAQDSVGFAAPPNVRLEDLLGLEEQKAVLLEAVNELKSWRPGKPRPIGGILLEGPPGTGKTQLIAAVANAANIPCLMLSASALQDMWWGETERRIRDLFGKARRHSPCIIALDEFEGLAMDRAQASHSEPGFIASIVTTLLTEMDANQFAVPILVLASTNYVNRVDPAFLRPGRLDRILHLGPPTAEVRRTYLSSRLPKVGMTEGLLDLWVRATAGRTLADLGGLTRQLDERGPHDHAGVAMREALFTCLLGPATRTPLDPEPLWMTAVHEAGQAVACAALLRQVPLLVSIRPRVKSLGGICLHEPSGGLVTDATRVRAELAVMMAGRVAEGVLAPGKKPTNGSSSNLELATELAVKAIGEWGLDPDWGLTCIGALPQEARVAMAPMLTKAIARWLTAAEATAERVLMDHRDAVLDLVDLLGAKLELIQDDLTWLVPRSGHPGRGASMSPDG